MAKAAAKKEAAPLNFNGPYLIYDTETNGLPIYDRPSGMLGQPRIVELAAMIIDKDDIVLDSMDVLIRPDAERWTIEPDLQAIHGITTERCLAEGHDIIKGRDRLLEMARRCTFRIAHNAAFDSRMVRIEIRKSGLGQDAEGWWKEFPTFDTQHKATRYCQLPPTDKMAAAGRRSFKTPKLVEAFAHFFPGDPLLNSAHAAAHDIEMTRRVFWAIQRTPEPEVEQKDSAPPPEPVAPTKGQSRILFAGADDE